MKFLLIVLHTFLILRSSNTLSKNFIIYSMAQDISMGDGLPQKKNYYINIGLQQGVKEGTELKVYRLLNRTNPYATEKNVTFKVEVGELKVIHSEDENAIAELSKLKSNSNIFVEIPSLNIGDEVGVKTTN